jgi:hypothetical protein
MKQSGQLFCRALGFNFPYFNNARSHITDESDNTTPAGGTVNGTTNMNSLANTLQRVYSLDAIKASILTSIVFPKSLQHVDVSFTGIGNRDLVHILSSLPNLQSLTANICKNLHNSLTIFNPTDSHGTVTNTENCSGGYARAICCECLHTLSLRGCVKLTGLELLSTPSLKHLNVSLCSSLQTLKLHSLPCLQTLDLSMLKKLDRLELSGCMTSLTSISVVGCENLLSTQLELKKTRTTTLNDEQKEVLIDVLNQWQRICPQMKWDCWIEESTGGSSLFAFKEVLKKWWEMKQWTKAWSEYAVKSPKKSSDSCSSSGDCEDRTDKVVSPSGSTKSSGNKRVTIDDSLSFELNRVTL